MRKEELIEKITESAHRRNHHDSLHQESHFFPGKGTQGSV